MESSDYKKTVSFHGNPMKAMDIFKQTLFPLGFKAMNQQGSCMKGPGIMSTRQSPMLGVSVIEVRITSGQISLKAELGGIRRVHRFLIFFISGLAIFFLILFQFLFGNNSEYSPFLPMAPFLPWPFLIPYLVKTFRSRCVSALNTLLENMVILSS